MTDADCSPVLKALSDETRWRIVHTLLHAEQASVGELVERLHVSQPNVSKHLRVLRAAGILVGIKEGSVCWNRVTPEFRRSLQGGEMRLEFGCCSFRFGEALQG